MHINLPEHSVAGINESMRRVSRDDDDAARFHLPLFIADGDGGAAFESKGNLDVRVFMQRRTLPGFRLDDVGGEGRAVTLANEVIRHSHKGQLLEIDETHSGRLRESLRGVRANYLTPA